MQLCPSCHRSVPDGATVCPHPGCGKPLSATASGVKKRPPPPPGKVQLTASSTHPVKWSSAAASGEGPRRGPLATMALLLLLFLLVGGIYYAATISKKSEPKPAQQVATNSNTAPDAATNERPTSGASAPNGDKPDNNQVQPDEPGEAAPPQVGTMRPDEKKETTEVAAVATPSQPLGLYSERTRPDRETWIADVGGTPVSEQGVVAGLDWLARHQAEDGHWGPDCLGPQGSRCEKDHLCSIPGGPFEAAQTGLALLAFQAGGNYEFNEKQYSDNVRRGLDWFVERQGPNGELVGSTNHLGQNVAEQARYDQHYMYEHAIGTFALAEACAVARAAQRHPDEKYLAAATKAVAFIESQQHNDGGWRYSPDKRAASDASVSGWAMLALKTAKEAELPVHDETISRMTAFFKRLADPLTGRTYYQAPHYVTDATTGVGMMVDEFIQHQTDSELVHLASGYLADQAESQWGMGRQAVSDYYLWYNCTLAMFMAGGDNWDRWNNVIRDHVISLQLEGDQCNRGSWEPNDRFGAAGGRVYSTALGVLTLEVYYRFAREKAAQKEDQPK